MDPAPALAPPPLPPLPLVPIQTPDGLVYAPSPQMWAPALSVRLVLPRGQA